MAILSKKLTFGLDISDFSIEALQLRGKGKLKAFGRVTLKEGIVKDGFILNNEKLAEKIEEVISKAKIKGDRVVLSLPESKIFTHLFKLPSDLKGERLKMAIISEAEKTIPLDIARVYWDYQVVSSKSKESQLVLFMGTLKEVVDDYLEVLEKVGLEAVAFEAESMALRRALLKDSRFKKGVMIIDIGARVTNISFFNKNSVLMESTIVPIAGNHFTEVIAKKLKISTSKAEKLKKKCGLNEKKEKGKPAKILEKELQPVIKKTRELTKHYGQAVGRVFLVGGSARLPKLAKYFSLNLGLKVDIGISPVAGQLKRKSILYNTVIGLALRGLERKPAKAGMNLLPKVVRPKPSLVSKRVQRKKLFPYLIVIFGILAFILLGWVVYTFVVRPLPKEPLPVKSPEVAPQEEIPEEEPIEEKPSLEITEEEVVKVIIRETETGWLNVRKGPDTSHSILTKIYPGESYPLLDEFDNWYKIKLEEGKEGWIASRYATTTE